METKLNGLETKLDELEKKLDELKGTISASTPSDNDHDDDDKPQGSCNDVNFCGIVGDQNETTVSVPDPLKACLP